MPLLAGPASWTDFWTIIASVTGTLLVVVPLWVKAIRPRLRKTRATFGAVVETLVGREQIRDKATGKILVEAQPGLGVRMATIEDAVVKLSDTDVRVRALENRQAAVEQRVTTLEDARVERVVTKAESAQMLGLVNAEREARGTEHTDED